MKPLTERQYQKRMKDFEAPGLLPAQIKRLGRPLSDAGIVKEGRGIVRTMPGAWSNGHVILYEEAPEVKRGWVRELEAEWMEEYPAKSTVPVWPVELSGSEKGDFVTFSDGNGTRAGYDAGYVSAVLKRAGRGDVSYHVDPATKFLTVRNGKLLGMVAPVRELPDDPDWSFRYTGELPKGGAL